MQDSNFVIDLLHDRIEASGGLVRCPLRCMQPAKGRSPIRTNTSWYVLGKGSLAHEVYSNLTNNALE